MERLWRNVTITLQGKWSHRYGKRSSRERKRSCICSWPKSGSSFGGVSRRQGKRFLRALPLDLKPTHRRSPGSLTCSRGLLSRSPLRQEVGYIDLGDLILITFQCGINNRRIQQVIEATCGTFHSLASLAKLPRVAEIRDRGLGDAATQGILLSDDWRRRIPLPASRPHKMKQVSIVMGADHKGRRDIQGFWVFGGKEGHPAPGRDLLGACGKGGEEHSHRGQG